MRALRTFGWTVMTIGILSLVLIPYLMSADRSDQVPGAIGAGVVGIALGFIVVTFVTKPTKR